MVGLQCEGRSVNAYSLKEETMESYQFSVKERYILETLQQPLAVYQFIDKKVVTLIISDGFCRLFGYSDKAQAYHDMDHDMYRSAHPDDAARVADEALRFASEDAEYDAVYRSKTKKSSKYRIIHANGETVTAEGGAKLKYVWYMDEGEYKENGGTDDGSFGSDLSRALHNESFVRLNSYDYLTGLPSMSYFFELADAVRTSMKRSGRRPAMIFFDFKGMKYFNTKQGFSQGDRLLQTFARLLAQMFGNDNCCRVGADHFAVICDAAGLEERLNLLFEQLQACKDPEPLPVHAGIYISRLDNIHISLACDRAKLACEALSDAYASCFNFYSDELSEDVSKKHYIVENIDRAIKEGWIRVYYQPIVRAVTEKVCDEEALARWLDPERGLLAPSEFIPALEESGFIYKLDLYVLEQILAKMQRQKFFGLYIVPHSVNLSRADFDACDIVEEIRARVDAAGVERSKITIEITESIVGSDFEFMKAQIERFQTLGFHVWMDDFGSGYSSLDVLQSIRFNLLKFDVSFVRRLDENDNAKIILTDMMKMATALGIDTVCEGVETADQVHFLQEIGCSKLQGYYYEQAIPFDAILKKYEEGRQIGFEDPREADYYESLGRINLYDLAVIAKDDESSIQNAFNMLPMGVIEVNGDQTRFVRSNQSYRDFIKRFIGLDLTHEGTSFTPYNTAFMQNIVHTCCELGVRSIYDEKMPDGTTVHSFARRIGVNPVNGNTAVAIAVLSVTKDNGETSYASIARALAADYYNLYYIDLDTDDFIEYTSSVGGEELAVERHGANFFDEVKEAVKTRIYEEDRAGFNKIFSKEKVIRELDAQGVFTATYRLIDTGKPMYVNMKITRMPGGNHIIMGISVIDAQMKFQARRAQKKGETV